MRIIDLLNKIANGEDVPKKIKYDGEIYEYDTLNNDYMQPNTYTNTGFLDEICVFSQLNNEVEILAEEKKIPEKFEVHSLGDKDEYGNFVSSPFPTNEEFMNKINEIIDYLKSKGE